MRELTIEELDFVSGGEENGGLGWSPVFSFDWGAVLSMGPSLTGISMDQGSGPVVDVQDQATLQQLINNPNYTLYVRDSRLHFSWQSNDPNVRIP